MTGLQTLLFFFIPKRYRAEAEAESRAWHAVCAACGHSISLWDLGGVRWKGNSRASTFGRCKACGKTGLHRLEKRNRP